MCVCVCSLFPSSFLLQSVETICRLYRIARHEKGAASFRGIRHWWIQNNTKLLAADGTLRGFRHQMRIGETTRRWYIYQRSAQSGFPELIPLIMILLKWLQPWFSPYTKIVHGNIELCYLIWILDYGGEIWAALEEGKGREILSHFLEPKPTWANIFKHTMVWTHTLSRST